MAARLLCVGLMWLAVAATAQAADPIGPALPGLAAYDAEIRTLMEKWDIPGASLAVARDGKLLLARGYGRLDASRDDPMTPASRFRLGSLAKPITAVAVMMLVEEGKLRLDDTMLPLLGELAPRAEAISDKRVAEITMRQLLQHTAGFDRDKSGDPLFQPRVTKIVERQKFSGRPTCELILKDTLEQPLDFAPGTRYAYSNVGYCILGRIVERAVGQPFEAFVRTRIFAPAGIKHIELGRSLEPLPGEVRYHLRPGTKLQPFAPGYGRGTTQSGYGDYPLEAMDALGRWVGSPTDFLRFFTAVDGQRGSTALLKPQSVKELLTPPKGVANEPGPTFYGLGFQFRELQGGGKNWWHGGTQPGVRTFAVRTSTGFTWVVAFNGEPANRGEFSQELDRTLWRAWQQVQERYWPRGDVMGEVD
jgi:CubicO group peptidase (beta-lactamase class C family)